tara:strand:+ start:18727 stop:20112 length:1386 start_codon:yes stop_codon:yes gene_type:complete
MKNFLYLTKNHTIQFTFRKLTGIFGKIVVVRNKKKVLIGVITEGDLRRALLNGFSLNDKLEKIINTNSTFLYKNELLKNKIIKSNFNYSNLDQSILSIPIVDEKKRVIEVLSRENVFNILKRKKKIKNKIHKNASNVLIIGGAGYIGSTLTNLLLKENFKVTIIDKLLYDKKVINSFKNYKNFKFIKADICNLGIQISSIKNIDIVVFLAELVGDPACNVRPEDALKTNYLSLSSLACLCSHLNIRKFIYTSSCSVYGVNKKNNFLTESSPLNPVSHYARIKIMSEKSLLSNSTQSFQPTILRLGTVFGPSLRNRFDLVVNTFAKNAFFKKKIEVFGGNQWRPNIHVEDVANGIISVINSPREKVGNKIFNLSNDKANYQIIQIAKFAKKEFPFLKLGIINHSGDNRNYRVSSRKFVKATNFKPRKSIIDCYKEFKKIFLKKIIKNPDNKIFSNIETLKKR